MELKHAILGEYQAENRLLIVLNGIETNAIGNCPNHPFLLIVLNGIETAEVDEKTLAQLKLLIVLNGIETSASSLS